MNERKERPILFSGEMVRAILNGRKTQTRRVIKPQPEQILQGDWAELCRYKPGDLLWVRETWAVSGSVDGAPPRELDPMEWRPWYRADEEKEPALSLRGRWRSARFMPKWAARLWLEVAAVRVERLQEISIDDLITEGYPSSQSVDGECSEAYEWFADLWDNLNTKRGFSWDSNPWVWAIEFKRFDRAND